MKQLISFAHSRYIIVLAFLSIVQAISFAQDKTISTTTSTTTTQTMWYTQPWAWIAGGIIFLLLIVALMRRRSSDNTNSTDKITVTKTVSRDRDV